MSRPAIVVTGACGFVGANLVLHLVARGHSVIACDRNPPPGPLRREVQRRRGRVRWVRLDVTDLDAWARLDTEPIERIVHGAALTPGRDDPAPARTIQVNLWGTVAALDYARRRGVNRFVFVSSSAVYGAPRSRRRQHETRRVRPAHPYALAKLTAERFVSFFRARYGVDACSARLGAVYGPWERPTHARSRLSPVCALAVAAARGDRITVSTLDVARDWIYAADAAAALAHLATVPRLPHEVFNVATGRAVSLRTIVAALQRLAPALYVEVTSPDRAHIVMRRADERAPLDVTRLRSLGFIARTDLATGLRRYLRWLRRPDTLAIGSEASTSRAAEWSDT